MGRPNEMGQDQKKTKTRFFEKTLKGGMYKKKKKSLDGGPGKKWDARDRYARIGPGEGGVVEGSLGTRRKSRNSGKKTGGRWKKKKVQKKGTE